MNTRDALIEVVAKALYQRENYDAPWERLPKTNLIRLRLLGDAEAVVDALGVEDTRSGYRPRHYRIKALESE